MIVGADKKNTSVFFFIILAAKVGILAKLNFVFLNSTSHNKQPIL